MTDQDTREELRLVEEEIAGIRESVAQLRRQIGDRSDGSVEPEETASTISSAEELEAILDTLQTRRDNLARRLGAD
jgi:SMC interacting uncharacterized protein involved in chromosome segregation